MRKAWWLAIGAGVVLVGLLVGLGIAFLRGGDNGANDATSEPCRPAEAAPSAGNANVEGRALGRGYSRQIVIRVTDKQSGTPVPGARVSVRGTMECPHFMPLYEKKLRETAKGTYKGDYQLIMQGEWIFNVIVRSEQSGSTTASFPVTLEIRG